MLKNFIKLFILLGVIIVVFMFNINNISYVLFNNPISNNNERLSRGTFNLVKQELFQYPKSEWPERINQLQDHFGYPIYIKNIRDMLLTSDEKQKLIKNKILLTQIDGADTWSTLLEDTELVLGVEMSQSNAENYSRSAQGTFYLTIKKIQSVPESQWQQQVDLIQEQFGFPLKLVPVEQLKLDKVLIDKINSNNIVAINDNTIDETYYKKINGSQLILQAGPLFDDLILGYLEYILMSLFASVIALGLYFWMRPIWRDLSRLDRVATRFGEGEFESRINLPKRSAIWHLANTFDNMAERINKLINSHKELTNAVSHELRTPISRLRFAIEMFNETNEEQSKQRFIKSMETDIDELEMLVSELLSYARFDRDKPKLEFNQLDISKWLSETVKKIKTENNYKNLHFINCSEFESVILNFDQKLIERALNNLIRNAVRYARSKVEISLGCHENKCSIIISDDGPGIPAADRKRMFEPFTRQDTSRNRSSGGYGLGLSIVQQVIKWHDGDVNISTSVYGGACFEVQLPITINK